LKFFLPEIDCDASNGVAIHSDFWQVVYSTGIVIIVIIPGIIQKKEVWDLSKL